MRKPIQAGKKIARDEFADEMAELMGVDFATGKKAMQAFEELVLQHIALEDTMDFAFGKIFGYTKEPQKIYGYYSVIRDLVGRDSWTVAKSGYPQIYWSNEAKRYSATNPTIYFERPETRMTSLARAYRADRNFPEIPEFEGKTDEEILVICRMADDLLYGKPSKGQILQDAKNQRARENTKKGRMYVMQELDKKMQIEAGVPEDQVVEHTYEEIMEALKEKWKSYNAPTLRFRNRKRYFAGKRSYTIPERYRRTELELDRLHAMEDKLGRYLEGDNQFYVDPKLVRKVERQKQEAQRRRKREEITDILLAKNIDTFVPKVRGQDLVAASAGSALMAEKNLKYYKSKAREIKEADASDMTKMYNVVNGVSFKDSDYKNGGQGRTKEERLEILRAQVEGQKQKYQKIIEDSKRENPVFLNKINGEYLLGVDDPDMTDIVEQECEEDGLDLEDINANYISTSPTRRSIPTDKISTTDWEDLGLGEGDMSELEEFEQNLHHLPEYSEEEKKRVEAHSALVMHLSEGLRLSDMDEEPMKKIRTVRNSSVKKIYKGAEGDIVEVNETEYDEKALERKAKRKAAKKESQKRSQKAIKAASGDNVTIEVEKTGAMNQLYQKLMGEEAEDDEIAKLKDEIEEGVEIPDETSEETPEKTAKRHRTRAERLNLSSNPVSVKTEVKFKGRQAQQKLTAEEIFARSRAQKAKREAAAASKSAKKKAKIAENREKLSKPEEEKSVG